MLEVPIEFEAGGKVCEMSETEIEYVFWNFK